MRTLPALSLLTLFAACTGTDVGNPPRGELTNFDTSACKKGNYQKGVDPLPAWQPDPALYSGLSCVLWEANEDVLRVRLTNHRDGCGVDHAWKPRVERHDAGLDLLLENPSCSVAACGNCIYDLSFDLRVSQLQETGELALRILGSDCFDQPRRVHHTLALPVASQSSGAICTYTFENFSLLGELPSGSLRGPCGASAGLEPPACQRGVCSAVTASTSLCLESCSVDAECAPSELMACREGTCQLRDPG